MFVRPPTSGGPGASRGAPSFMQRGRARDIGARVSAHDRDAGPATAGAAVLRVSLTPRESRSYTASYVRTLKVEVLLSWPLHVSIPVFVAAAAAILLSGMRLPVLGERVARRAGIGATTFGLFVLAVITSLPELAVTLTAMLGVREPDLAMGNVLGSNNFNVMILAFLPAGLAGGALLRQVDVTRYTRTCLLLLVLTVITGAGIWIGKAMPPGLAAVVFSLLIVGIFLWEVGSGGRGSALVAEDPSRASSRSGSGDVAKFWLYAAVVVAAGVLVSRAGNEIAGHEFSTARGAFTLGTTFVGTVFVAIATSLPEVTVAFGAVRRARSADMALGTLLGSNSINLVIFAIGAPFLTISGGRSGWSVVQPVHMVNVVTAVVLTLVVLAGMRATALDGRRRAARVATAVLVPIYLVGLFLVYRGGWG